MIGVIQGSCVSNPLNMGSKETENSPQTEDVVMNTDDNNDVAIKSENNEEVDVKNEEPDAIEQEVKKRESTDEESPQKLRLVRPKPISMISSRSPPSSGENLSPSAMPAAYSPCHSSSSSCHEGSPSLGSPQVAPGSTIASPLGSPSTASLLANSAATAGHPLFQPFLPFVAGRGSDLSSPNGIPISRPLPFSIDNILKPTFGGKEAAAAAVAAAGSRLFSPFLGMGLATSILHQQQQNLLAVQAALNRSSTTKENTFSSSPALSPPQAFSPPSMVSPMTSPSKKTPKQLNKIKQEPPPPASSPEKGTLPKEAIEAAKKKTTTTSSEPVDLSKNANNNNDGDVPPGMVRGPNGQLWPAWVFCTRYSDRPSSGKQNNIFSNKESIYIAFFQEMIIVGCRALSPSLVYQLSTDRLTTVDFILTRSSE